MQWLLFSVFWSQVKTKRLYGRMQHGIQLKKDAVGRLEEKRKEIDISTNSLAEPVTKKQKKLTTAPAIAVVAPALKADKKEKVEKKVKLAKHIEAAIIVLQSSKSSPIKGDVKGNTTSRYLHISFYSATGQQPQPEKPCIAAGHRALRFPYGRVRYRMTSYLRINILLIFTDETLPHSLLHTTKISITLQTSSSEFFLSLTHLR